MVSFSMSFSRSSSLYSKSAAAADGRVSDKASDPQDPQRNRDAAILDPDRLPTWQRPFLLGPNVRFTRTPHKKQPMSDEPKVPGKVEALAADDVPPPSPATVLQDRIADELPAERSDSSCDIEVRNAAETDIDQPKVAMDFLFHPIQPPVHQGPPEREDASSVTVEITSQTDETLVAPEPAFDGSPPDLTEATEPSQTETPTETAENTVSEHTVSTPDHFAFLPDGLAFEVMGLGLMDAAGEEPLPVDETLSQEPVGEREAVAEQATDAVPEVQEQEEIVSDYSSQSEVGLADLLTTSGQMPLTAVSDPVETAAEEPSDEAEHAEAEEDVGSPVALYRQVEVRSFIRQAVAEEVEDDEAEAVADAPEALEAHHAEESTADTENEDAHNDEETCADPEYADAAGDMNEAGETDEAGNDDEPQMYEDDATEDEQKEPASVIHVEPETDFVFPSLELLQAQNFDEVSEFSQEALEQSAGQLESILEDFGVKGEIIDVRPGPVVTQYEFEPAPGVKSSRVINLSDDIARSMSALSARVAVIPGRNVIGIELPNEERETVFLRELLESRLYMQTDFRLPLCLGKNIGGEPVVAELAKMPHLLVAGTTGSGKSVAINTMILSLLYHLRPEECRLIMVDPKMLELSVYDGIPHLLTPVVTDPKKAVLALKWAVREMEDRYRKMARLGVRNIDGFNKRVAEARASGETIMVSVPTGFDRTTGEQTFEEQELDLSALPYIVVIVDEMADLMMVAGKEIEGTIQRLAQMARAAGIHLIMATQRPSVDVITGTIKANFPTRISFQVTSKIDSRTILGEQGAEYLLGQGDMLHMKGGGRIARVHGPFVSDYEVEKVVAHLKRQGTPTYLGSVTVDEEEAEGGEEDTAVFDNTDMGAEGDEGDDLFAKAVRIVQRDKKCSTSYIQRRLSIGYNRAASLVERMEQEGLVGPANHVGKREILDTGSAG